jgi:predicted nucleic acid-binding protein
MLDASRLVDFKKAKVLARTAGVDESIGEASYVVEFSMRNGARLRYWFGTSSRLLLAIEDKTQGTMSNFADYRVANGILEPHQIRWVFNKDQSWTLRLQDVQYNTGLAETLFDPPSLEAIDVVAVLKELDGNQEKVDERVTEYTYTEKRTERKINDKGEVTEEVVKVFEVYPLAGRYDVHKLVSENGVALSPDKAAKEEKRVTDEMDKAERERIKIALKRESEKQKGKKEKTDDEDLGVADFLRVAELVSPRRERLRDRDAIVFDFRPRAGYKPKGSVESIVSKLAGVVWVDPVDKQVMRLEARLIESYKMGGGLLASVRPGTALVFEQKRMEDGVWLPVYAQVNISAKILLFKGINMNVVQEFSNYHRFKSNVDDYKITSP